MRKFSQPIPAPAPRLRTRCPGGAVPHPPEESPMFNIFQTISDRLRALFVADLALEFEARLLARQADRRAELLVQAEQHARHGFPAVAQELRQQAEALSLDRPLAAVLLALEH